MSVETELAFAHPEKRSRATGAANLDRISLRDHVVDVEIGAFQTERGVTQRISFNVVVEVRPSSGADTDDVDDILSYDRVTEAIAAELAAERLNLLETLAERVARRILTQPQAERVFVRIEKLDRGVGTLGVEIVRAKTDIEPAEMPASTVDGVVYHLTARALRSTDLTGWLSRIVSSSRPAILTVAAPELVEIADRGAQRRIELLKIEQAAWELAKTDPRCVVVDTWTELDWGLKHGQLSVWAPSKIVFDSTDPKVGDLTQAHTLSQWLARQLGMERHIVIDETLDLSSLTEMP